MGGPLKLLVINNLASGFQDGLIYDYLRQVSGDGDTMEVRCTDGTTPIESLLDDAERFDAVVAAGGDGTIATVAYRLARTGIPILPFPAGTGNLLAANLHEPLEPHALARITREMHTLDFDLGEIRCDGSTFGFCIMAGAGYDATIMHDAQPAKKTLGAFAYFQAALTNNTPQVSRITLTIDGETVHSEGLGVLLVNFPRIQFEIPLIPDTDARDGVLEAVILKAENAFGLIPALMAGIMDREGEHPGRSDSVDIYRGHRVEVAADPPFQIQYDGETPGLPTPFTAEVLPQAARFIVSESAYKLYSGE